jgi:RHS repeat-associated protein
VGIAYDDANRRTSLTLPNSIVVEYGYDNASQLTGLTYKLGGNTLGTLTYTYDADGRRTGVDGTYARATLPLALTSATYDNANQIATWAGTSFTYDPNGNLVSDGTKAYTWNARNELTAINGGASAGFAYDAFGRRRSKTVSGTTTQFLYDVLNPVQELVAGSPMANLLTGLGIDEYFTRTEGSGTSNYLRDALGSSVALADSGGTILTEYTYQAFGGTETQGAANGNSFQFTGREADAKGLHYYRARYYDPRLQRFITEDPLAFRDGPNQHVYVLNDPIDNVDPLGLEIFIVGQNPWIPRALAPLQRFNPGARVPKPSSPFYPKPSNAPWPPERIVPPRHPLFDAIEAAPSPPGPPFGGPLMTTPPISRPFSAPPTHGRKVPPCGPGILGICET